MVTKIANFKQKQKMQTENTENDTVYESTHERVAHSIRRRVIVNDSSAVN